LRSGFKATAALQTITRGLTAAGQLNSAIIEFLCDLATSDIAGNFTTEIGKEADVVVAAAVHEERGSASI
jgi:hypothetical protein